jgi:hypothetical protein
VRGGGAGGAGNQPAGTTGGVAAGGLRVLCWCQRIGPCCLTVDPCHLLPSPAVSPPSRLVPSPFPDPASTQRLRRAGSCSSSRAATAWSIRCWCATTAATAACWSCPPGAVSGGVCQAAAANAVRARGETLPAAASLRLRSRRYGSLRMGCCFEARAAGCPAFRLFYGGSLQAWARPEAVRAPNWDPSGVAAAGSAQEDGAPVDAESAAGEQEEEEEEEAPGPNLLFFGVRGQQYRQVAAGTGSSARIMPSTCPLVHSAVRGQCSTGKQGRAPLHACHATCPFVCSAGVMHCATGCGSSSVMPTDVMGLTIEVDAHCLPHTQGGRGAQLVQPH